MQKVVLGILALLLAGCGGQPLQGAASSATHSSAATVSPTASESASPTASPTPSGPHFVEVPASAQKQANASQANPWAATVVFHEVGLRAGQSIDYFLSAKATANYACNSTTALDQSNQQVVMAQVHARRAFAADGSGSVMSQLTLEPPPAPATTCPAGYQLGPWKVSFVGVVLEDITNIVAQPEPDMGGVAQ